MFPYNVSHNTLSFSLTFLFIFLTIDVGRTLPCFVVDRNIAKLKWGKYVEAPESNATIRYMYTGTCDDGSRKIDIMTVSALRYKLQHSCFAYYRQGGRRAQFTYHHSLAE